MNLTVAALSREGRTPPGAAEIGQVVLAGTVEAPNGVDAIAPLEELNEAERQAGRVTVDTRALGARAQRVEAAGVASTAKTGFPFSCLRNEALHLFKI